MIPERMRGTILSQLHKGHQGVEKTRMLAGESVYWTRINDDIDKSLRSMPGTPSREPRGTYDRKLSANKSMEVTGD